MTISTSAANSSTRKLINKRLKTTTPSRSAFEDMKLIREEIKEVRMITRDGGLKEKMMMEVSYKECRKNHAASIGGYAVDGCREFMAAGEEGTAAAFNCAACGCHRNFHRKEVESDDDCCCDCSSISANSAK